jgi:hypothetical protein
VAVRTVIHFGPGDQNDPAGTKEPSGVDMPGHDFRGRTDLRGAHLHQAVLAGANLAGVDLFGVDPAGSDLRGADLRGADLRGADLGYTDQRGDDLTGADWCLQATTSTRSWSSRTWELLSLIPPGMSTYPELRHGVTRSKISSAFRMPSPLPRLQLPPPQLLHVQQRRLR